MLVSFQLEYNNSPFKKSCLIFFIIVSQAYGLEFPEALSEEVNVFCKFNHKQNLAAFKLFQLIASKHMIHLKLLLAVSQSLIKVSDNKLK